MTIKALVSMAREHASIDWTKPIQSYPVLAARYDQGADYYAMAWRKTKSAWRKRLWNAKAQMAAEQAERWRRDERYRMEARRDWREQIEAYADQGYTLVEVIRHSTFNTQPWPLEYAGSHARRTVETLQGLGFHAKAVLVDYEYHRYRDSYWGTWIGNPSGTYHVLVEGPVMVAEMAKRAYTEYWQGRGLDGIVLRTERL